VESFYLETLGAKFPNESTRNTSDYLKIEQHGKMFKSTNLNPYYRGALILPIKRSCFFTEANTKLCSVIEK